MLALALAAVLWTSTCRPVGVECRWPRWGPCPLAPHGVLAWDPVPGAETYRVSLDGVSIEFAGVLTICSEEDSSICYSVHRNCIAPLRHFEFPVGLVATLEVRGCNAAGCGPSVRTLAYWPDHEVLP